MRLLNAKTRQLENFMGSTPPYAILSHTWGNDEFLFEDIQNGTGREKSSYRKIERCCELAISQGYEYVWIDTCCIDKSSSAELSEAINSMFRWYRDSAVCYAFLADILDERDSQAERVAFYDSKWFTRGWTLQELIAPRFLVFYNSKWDLITSREDVSQGLSQEFNIDKNLLTNDRNTLPQLSKISIAKRMSWASKRQTTRPEDMAYCHLGIFDVSMPLLYGEGGQKAFFRLQEEIMKCSMDQSILAWELPERQAADITNVGVLADSPAAFENASRIVPYQAEGAAP